MLKDGKGGITLAKNVVQVGLHNTAEYKFLANRNDIESYPLPIGLQFKCDWKYHGVEPQPESYEQFKDTDVETYYCCAITDVDGDIEIVNFRDRPKKIEVTSFRLESFFQKIALAHCDLLVLDVEGWECAILKDYEGKIPIDYLIVEYHQRYIRHLPYMVDIDAFETLCVTKGFEILCKFVTNYGRSLEYHLKRMGAS